MVKYQNLGFLNSVLLPQYSWDPRSNYFIGLIQLYSRRSASTKLTRCHMFFLFLLLFFLVKYFRLKVFNNTVFYAIFVIVKDKNRSKISLFTLFFNERVENTIFYDIFFFNKGFKYTANTTIFFMFLFPILKANQPKIIICRVF